MIPGDLCNIGGTVGPIRPEGEVSVIPVRSKESSGTCKTSKDHRGGSTRSMNYVENHRQDVNLGRYLEV